MLYPTATHSGRLRGPPRRQPGNDREFLRRSIERFRGSRRAPAYLLLINQIIAGKSLAPPQAGRCSRDPPNRDGGRFGDRAAARVFGEAFARPASFPRPRFGPPRGVAVPKTRCRCSGELFGERRETAPADGSAGRKFPFMFARRFSGRAARIRQIRQAYQQVLSGGNCTNQRYDNRPVGSDAGQGPGHRIAQRVVRRLQCERRTRA